MTEGLTVANIAAIAAIFGGLLTALATRSVEKMRFQHGVEEKNDERKFAAVVRFTNAAFAWFDWLRLMEQDAKRVMAGQPVANVGWPFRVSWGPFGADAAGRRGH